MSPPRRSDQSTAIAATSRARGPGRSQLSSGQSPAAAPAMPVPKVQNTSTQPVSRASAWQTQAAAITASMATRIAAISYGRAWTPAMSVACDSPDQLAQESLSFQRPLSGGDAQATAILVQHLGPMHHFGVALDEVAGAIGGLAVRRAPATTAVNSGPEWPWCRPRRPAATRRK